MRQLEGLPVIDSVEETTSNGELARFTINYTTRANVTEAITENIFAASEDATLIEE